ncbi:hypothetical protein [Mycolicibacterium sp. OfavD-34-C]|uniref:hypothetical protein n=1 Tax=Mycolicibacterium sp. OfavD-34-C TaxID=2917746 RepID=UPI001EF64E09|nr:hypothetical protein [Mycolicibacterium sp. OfavD-34-C]MCG7579719.1 hypothetical protein [Mycolicibacterium sp. OfavD-34-C]
MGYRLDVITDDVPEAVRRAGGLMFDYGRAGWQVVVITDDDMHSRALTILGARVEAPRDDIQTGCDNAGRESRAVVAPLGALRQHPELGAGYGSRVLLWGEHLDQEPAAGLCTFWYQLSAAARSFKACALGSVGGAPAAGRGEQFWMTNRAGALSGLCDEPTRLCSHLERRDGGRGRWPTAMEEFVRG